MADLRFDWDSRKDTANRRKQGVTFEEARTVFSDPAALLIDDPDHSQADDRFILIGMSAMLRIVLVCHAYHERDDIVRIISARRANPDERNVYASRWKP